MGHDMKIVCNLETNTVDLVPLSDEEQADLVARQNSIEEPPPAPTKEQLMAELAALTAKINAME